MDKKPTHEQARLHLQVYDLRREARLREAAGWARGERDGSLLAAALHGLWRGLSRTPGQWRD